MTHSQPPHGHRRRIPSAVLIILAGVAVLLCAFGTVAIAEAAGLVAGPDGPKIVRRG